MRIFFAAVAPLICAATCHAGVAPPAFVGSDDFNAAGMDSSKWNALPLGGTAALTQSGDGVVHYTVPSHNTSGSDSAAWLWTPGTAPYASDWSMQLDVSNPRTIGTGQYFNIGIGVRQTGNLNNNGFSVRLDATDGTPQSVGWETDKEIGGTATMDRVNTAVTSGSVLLTWSASTHLLRAAFDANGATGGYVWTGFSTLDPTQAGTWNMQPSDSFTFVLTGSSNNANIASSDGVSADNFAIANTAAVIASTVPEPGTCLLLLCGAASFAGVRVRRTAAGRFPNFQGNSFASSRKSR